MRIATLCFIVILVPLVVVGQNQSAALLVSECGGSGGRCDRYNLVRFRFRNGVLVSKDLILSTDYTRVRYDLGKNHIYKNRYVITNWGDVVDIQDKKLLHDGHGKYVATEGDWIVQHESGTEFRGHYYYDLKANRYRRFVVPTKWDLPGLLAPDQLKSVDGEMGDSIWLHRFDRGKQLLGSGFRVDQALESSFIGHPPVFWLDNTRVLTQRDNGDIVVLQLDGTVIPIVKIPITTPNYSQPFFFRDPGGRIIYRCTRTFVINVEEKSYTPHEWTTLGFGFDAQTEKDPSYGHIIRYQGKEIGRLWASVWGAPATDGHVAFEYGDVGSNLGYPKGIQVWSSANNNWTTIGNMRIPRIIGWVPE